MQSTGTVWIYVVALLSRGDSDSAVYFKHTFVTAANERDAYNAGFRSLHIEDSEDRINDYVVEIGTLAVV